MFTNNLRLKTRRCIFFFILLLTSLNILQAQQIIIDQINTQCSNLRQDQREKIAVAKFNNSTSLYGEALQNSRQLSSMLTNALSNVNCFMVIASNQDLNTLQGTYGGNGTTQNIVRPQIIVAADLLEYSVKTTQVVPGNVLFGNTTEVRINFTIKLISVQNGVILTTKSITIYDKGKKTQAQNVAQKGIDSAVVFIAMHRDAEKSITEPSNTNSKTDIKVLNANFSALQNLANLLSSQGTIQQKSFNNGVGEIALIHHGTTDDIANYINAHLQNQFEITGEQDGEITLKARQ